MLSSGSITWAVMLMLRVTVPMPAQEVMTSSRQVDVQRNPDPLAVRAGLSVENVALLAALTELHQTSGVAFAFSPSLIPPERKASCDCEDVSVRTALERLLKGTSLGYAAWHEKVLVEPKPPSPVLELNRVTPATEARRQLIPPTRGLVRQAQPSVDIVGSITGVVIDTRSRKPLPGVQVHLPEHQIGAITDNVGRYRLNNVPAGEVLVRADLIGYGTSQRTVTIADDQAVTVDFELMQEALALDAVVVTGTPGGTQRRAIGNVVERIDAGSVLQRSPAIDIQQLIGQRNPGVSVMPSSGQVGGVGGAIRIRGVSSLTQNNSPMLYVDGVRVDGGFSGPSTREGRNINRMNDINPEDIARIEVIKGPAAATLYGTEASAGVIQVITKRGSTGSPSFDITARQGMTWLQSPAERLGLFYDFNRETSDLRSFNLYEHEDQHGLGPVFQYGHLQSYTASISGGTATSRYYVSADWEDNEGIVSYNWQKRFSSRVNLSVAPHPNLDFDLNAGFVQGTTSLAQQSSGWDIWSNLLWGSPRALDNDSPLRGFLRATPEAIATIEALSKINRFTTGVTVNFRPTPWFTHRALIGMDVGEEVNSIYFPRHPDGADHFFGASSLGEKSAERPRTMFQTVDYAATANLGLFRDLRSVSSFGFQYYRRQTEEYTAEGNHFPVPGLSTVGAGAVRIGDETFTENATVGVFLQQQFDWRNRLFVTGAVRFDDNSAFGAEYEAAIYPKVSATWVLHEEPFWNVPVLSALRLRAAWGAAGQQPGTFDASRLYSATTGPGDGPVITPSSFGNPELKPERSVELEAGFDAGFWEDRVNLAFTYYNRTTNDVIVNRQLPPSMGFPGSQVINLGQTKNWGTEFALDARVVDRPQVSFDLGLNFTTMRDEITDLGGEEVADLHVGYPIASEFFWRVLSADIDENGNTSNEMCDGGTGPQAVDPGGSPVPCAEAPRVYWGNFSPTWEFGVNATVSLFRNLQLYGRIDARGGNMGANNDITSAHTSYLNTLYSNLQDNAIFQAYRKIGRDPLRFYDAGFWKLREVSATYTVPQALAQRFAASSASISVAARNLWTIKAQKRVTVPGIGEIPDPQIWDTEMGGFGNLPGTFQSRIPPLAQVVTTVRLSF